MCGWMWLRCFINSFCADCPPEQAKPLYLEYAALEEQHGLARHAMQVSAAAASQRLWLPLARCRCCLAVVKGQWSHAPLQSFAQTKHVSMGTVSPVHIPCTASHRSARELVGLPGTAVTALGSNGVNTCT